MVGLMRWESEPRYKDGSEVVPQQGPDRGIVGRLPVNFTPNRGQYPPEVVFAARGYGSSMFFLNDGVTYSFPAQSSHRESPLAIRMVSLEPERRWFLQMRLVSADPVAAPVGDEPVPGKSHFFKGSDPTQWTTDVQNYRKIVYRSVYPGIDLVFHGTQKALKYDFVVQPGADPGQIAFEYDGARNVEIDETGRLVITGSQGKLVEEQPLVYQRSGDQVTAVQGAYKLQGNRVSFSIGPFDRTRELIIDPTITYSSVAGGSGNDVAHAIAVDDSGYVYLAGGASSGYPTTSGAFDETSNGARDAFVSKFRLNGNGASDLVYSTFLGGDRNDRALGITVDDTGQVYITGFTTSLVSSVFYPTTTGAFQTSHAGGSTDAFITKISADGSALIYSTFVGGSGSGGDSGGDIKIDTSGNIYISGQAGQGFPTTAGAYDQTFNGGASDVDAFVVKLNPAGSGAADLIYSSFLGGSGPDGAAGLALDDSSIVCLTGYASSGFPIKFPLDSTQNGDVDAFMARIDPAGNGSADLRFSTFFGGVLEDRGNAITLDATGQIFITGHTLSNNLPTTVGAFDRTTNSGFDVFVAKFSANAGSMLYSTYIGNAREDIGFGIAVDATGVIYVSGSSGGSQPQTVPTTPGAFDETGNGFRDAFMLQINPAGGGSADLLYSTVIGGAEDDYGYGLALDASGNVYICGQARTTGFPTTSGAYDEVQNGGDDAFVAQFPPLSPPAIQVIPDQIIVVGSLFSVTVVDSAGNPSSVYSLVVGPAGMSIDAGTGVLTWTPTISQIGDTTVTVRATNTEGFDDESFNLRVIEVIANEFVANPTFANDDGEFVEFFNPSHDTLDLNNWDFETTSGGLVTVSAANTSNGTGASTRIPPGGFWIIARNTTRANFQTNYSVTFTGDVLYTDAGATALLDNAGFPLSFRLLSSSGDVVDSVSYAAGQGAESNNSFELIDPSEDNSDASGANWTQNGSGTTAGAPNNNWETTPPAAVTGLLLNTNPDVTITLNWTNPSDLDFLCVLILRRRAAMPTGTPVQFKNYAAGDTIAPGDTVVFVGRGTTYNDTLNLIDLQRYFYRVFAFDEVRNYSAASANGDIKLPVELAFFSARYAEGKVHLDWTTESETNNAHWLVERKPAEAGVEQYTGVAQIAGQGTKPSATQYKWIDTVPAGVYQYRLADVSLNGVVTYHPEVTVSVMYPNQYRLYQNYPNPFNPETSIRYDLPEASDVKLVIFDVLGREVGKYSFTGQPAGFHKIVWNAGHADRSAVASGVYFFRLSARGVTGRRFEKVHKMMVIK